MCLPQTASPKAEEVECLCKLVRIVGRELHIVYHKEEGTELLDAYLWHLLKMKEAKSDPLHHSMVQARYASGHQPLQALLMQLSE